LRKDATMARTGLVALLCAVPILGSASLSADPVKEPEGSIDGYLLAQTATLQAEMYLMQQQPAKAVEVLEAPLPRVNVNRKYLAVLRNAYRAYIHELQVKNQTALAEKYAARLRILENNPAAVTAEGAKGPPAQPAAPTARTPSDPGLGGLSLQPAAPAPAVAPPVTAALASGTGAGSPLPGVKPALGASPQQGPAPGTARGKVLEDPFDASYQATPAPGKAPSLLAQAEAEYARRRYGEAWKFYEEAHKVDRKATQGCQDRWAYCKLHRVVEQMNDTAAPTCDWTGLEREVRTAMALAPNLEKAGKRLLSQIEERRGAPGEAAAAPAAAVTVRHPPRTAQGWDVAETTHFRVLHRQPREFAEKVARTAERTRREMSRKWFGEDGAAWAPKCDVYLHATAAAYGRATGQATNSPGHSRIETDPAAGRVVSRVIHLHCENPDALLGAVLPHEATHVVLAGQFGRQPVPRWADEGIAVLTEPPEKVALHRRNLARCREELFAVGELMQLKDYPHPRRISAFYAQSVSLVDYLSGLKGPQTFARFLKDGLRAGYEPALRQHYGISGFADLQGRWAQHVAADLGGPATYAAGRRP
jgi:tetratricopeptide (TPR) repeat protein